MARVEIYTTMLCGYCHAAKRLLGERGVAFVEYDVGGDRDKRAAMAKRAAGRTSVPQIFISDRHVGGCDDLYALDRAGKLAHMLAEP